MVLGSYEGVVLNKSGMCVEMLGPCDRMKLLEICRNILIEEMDSEATVVMNRTRTPYFREGIIFTFCAWLRA